MYNSCFLAKSLMARVRPIIAAALAIFVLTTTSTLVLPVISAFDAIADEIQQGIVRKRKRKTQEVWCASVSEKSAFAGTNLNGVGNSKYSPPGIDAMSRRRPAVSYFITLIPPFLHSPLP